MRRSGLQHLLMAAALAAAALTSTVTGAVNVGDKAPAFTLPATVGKQASLSDFAGKSVVLFFYTGAFTNS